MTIATKDGIIKAMKIEQLVEMYLQSKQNSWSPTTLKSERSRLRTLTSSITSVDALDPQTVLKQISSAAAYTIQTSWTRATDFYQWLIDRGYVDSQINIFKKYRAENKNRFKYSYERKTPKISYAEAKEKILAMENKEIARAALTILSGGLRISEISTLERGYCIGKGNKRRRVYVDDIQFNKSLSYFRKVLKKETGLKPHDLRKIKATEVSKKGARPEQLCALFGWNSFETARSYLNPGHDDELKGLMNG